MGIKEREIKHLIILLFIWTLITTYLTISNPLVKLSDMFWFIWIGEHLFSGNISVWVNGFYPFGYPLLLKFLTFITNDYVISGRIVSLFAGIGGILLIFLIAKKTFDKEVAIYSAIFLMTNPTYLKFSTTSSTDLIATTLLLMGIYQFILYEEEKNFKNLIFSGFFFGLSYLFRYTTLTVLPLFFLLLIFKIFQKEGNGKERKKEKVKGAFLFLLTFLITTSPQLILSTILKGNPFYNLEAQNVYFGIFGNGNWGQKMKEAANYTNIFQIILNFPSEFFRNWIGNLHQSLKSDLILQFPLNLIAIPGIFMALKYKRTRRKNIPIILSSLSFLLLISMAFVNKRLLLFDTVIFSIFASFMFKKMFGEKVRKWMVFLLALSLFLVYIFPKILNPIPQKDIERLKVAEVISKCNIKDPREVLSFSFEYYATKKKTKDRFSIPWHDEKDFIPYSSIKDIAERMKRKNQKILVYDEKAPFNVSGVKNFWPFKEKVMEKYFTPIATISGKIKIYRLKEK